MKMKITYTDFNNEVKAKIINSYGWYNIYTEIQAYSIYENQIIKIEKVFEASVLDTEDLTQ
jgi:hypothetical protein